MRRDALGQRGVEDRHIRHQRGMRQHLFAATHRIDNHRHIGGFRPGASGGRHRDQRQTWTQLAVLRHLPQRLLRIGDQQRHRLRRIQYRSTAKGHHAVAARVPQLGDGGADIGDAGFAGGTGPESHSNPFHRQATLQPGGHSRLMEKTVNHDKQMPKAPGLRLRTAGRQRADAVQRHRRNVEAFHLLKIQRIKGMEQRRLQFSLHTSPPLFPSRCWRLPAGS